LLEQFSKISNFLSTAVPPLWHKPTGKQQPPGALHISLGTWWGTQPRQARHSRCLLRCEQWSPLSLGRVSCLPTSIKLAD
jgi:hypothetical protein